MACTRTRATTLARPKGTPKAPLEFLGLDAPTHADIAEVASRTASRIEKILKAHGRSLDPELGEGNPPQLCLDEPALTGCYAAAAQGISVSGQSTGDSLRSRTGKPLLRLLLPQEPPARPRASDITDQPIAEVRGVNIHAAQLVDGRDRRRVERLCEYITRPPVARTASRDARTASWSSASRNRGVTARAPSFSSPTT